MNEFELKILDFIAEHFKCGFLDFFMPLVTKLGDGGIFWIIVALVLICTKKYRKTGIMVGVALLIGLLIGNLTLKPLIARVRPYDMPNVDIKLLVEKLSDKSFPSGHTLASFEAATVLMIRDKKLGIPALVLAFIIAFSRLYLYVHYPTDVLAGAVLGVLFGVLACFIVNKVNDLYNLRKLRQ
ncbi:MAG: phosphatase PAP2 family protein [Clostridia bacterium]|nr:phosphatase PAP2 family protein [Clostridia bacterium]